MSYNRSFIKLAAAFLCAALLFPSASNSVKERAKRPLEEKQEWKTGKISQKSTSASDAFLPVRVLRKGRLQSDTKNTNMAIKNKDYLPETIKCAFYDEYTAKNDAPCAQKTFESERAKASLPRPVDKRRGITDQWTVKCSRVLSLRKEARASSPALTQIKNGEKVTLICFEGRFAQVKYDIKDGSGKIIKNCTGYLPASGIVLPEEHSAAKELDIVKPVYEYSYEQMLTDIYELEKKHPERLRVFVQGKSEEGRDIILAKLGNPASQNKILIHASIHAREYMTTLLLMAQIDYMLSHEEVFYKDTDMTIGDILERVCFFIVPMVNPDGVNIVQSGRLPKEFAGKYTKKQIQKWKANAKGVDLNANFDAGWEQYGKGEESVLPGPQGYKGECAECAAESRAIANLARETKFDLTVSYHTSGSVIYSSYGKNQTTNNKGRELAERIYKISGLTQSKQSFASTAGFKDWAIEKLHIPSLTIEFGCGGSPLKLQEFSGIWRRGRDIPIECAVWLLDSNDA